jgi:hypothetical protein
VITFWIHPIPFIASFVRKTVSVGVRTSDRAQAENVIKIGGCSCTCTHVSPYVQENTNCVITQIVTHINLQKFLLFVLYIPLEFGQWLQIIHESDQAIEENYRVSHCALTLLYTSQTDPMLAPHNTVQTPKSSLVPQGKDPSRAGIGKSKAEWLHSMNQGWTQPSMFLIYSIEFLIAPLSVTVYSYTQFSSNLLHFLVSTHGPCPSNLTNINPLKKTTWNLGIISYISTNSNCWLIHHELFSRIKEGATDQEQNAEPPEMLSTAAILSHMKHKPLRLRLLNPMPDPWWPKWIEQVQQSFPVIHIKDWPKNGQ